MKNRDIELESGREKFSRFTLTTRGEVIRLRDYCCRLAKNKNVHVVLFDDSNFTKVLIEEKYVHPSVRSRDSMNELNLLQRHGLSRLHYFLWADIKNTLEFITHQRQALDQRTFMFPHVLKDHTHLHTLEDVEKREEMLIDLRDAKDMLDLKNNASRNSLTSELTVIK